MIMIYATRVITLLRASRGHMADLQKLVRLINRRAPTRICDNGGWTDTWFAQYGTVFNIAISPTVEVQLSVFSNGGSSAPFTINARTMTSVTASSSQKARMASTSSLKQFLTACPSRKVRRSSYRFLAKARLVVPPERRLPSRSLSSGHWTV